MYIAEPMRISGTGLVHFSRLKDRFATHFVPFAQFEADAANGDLPDFSFIEPSLGVGHTLDTPRDPATWPTPQHRPVPAFMEDPAALGASLSTLGKTLAQGIREYADQNNIEIEGLPKDPQGGRAPRAVADCAPELLCHLLPAAGSGRSGAAPRPDRGVRQP